MGDDFSAVEVGSRYEQSRLLLVGEASGEHEAREGLPFRPYAQSGSLLADALREVNISRSELAITNVIRCRPKNDYFDGSPYQYAATQHCISSYLQGVINDLRPRAILALGGTAYRALCSAPKGRYGTLDYARGYVVRGGGCAEGIPVIATYHPAFIRRGAAHLTPLLQRDLRRAFLLAAGKLVEGRHYLLDVGGAGLAYQTAPSLAEAWAFAEQIDPDLPLAFDIETPLSTRSDEDERTSFTDRDIKLFQCTQRRREGIAIPFRDEYIEVIREILRRSHIRAGFNNWSFDDPVLRANDIDVESTDDAMVMFGFAQPDLPKNLQGAAQWCGFPFPWKALGETDLELYGCVDVDATLCVYQFLRAQLEREGRWETYRRYFREVWPILRDMANRGVPVSEERRGELKALIAREDLRVTAAVRAIVPADLLGVEPKHGYKRVPKDLTGLVEREFILEKEEKCQCLKTKRGSCAVCAGTGIMPSGLVVMRWATPVEFNPNSSHQVKRFMKHLKHPIPKHAKRLDATGEASDTTEVKELERLYVKTKHPIYPLLIEKRQLTKLSGTYVDGWTPSRDGRVHTTYTFQTATWQTSSRAPNVQNGIKHSSSPFQKALASGFNGMLKAEPGFLLVNFDFKSFHALTTAFQAESRPYERLARIDIHSFVAAHAMRLPERVGLYERDDADMAALFKHLKKDEKFKFFRDFKAKRTILGIQFGLGYRKLYQMYKEDFESETEAKELHHLIMYDLFPDVRKWQDAVKAKAAEDKRLVSLFGAVRHFYDVQRWDRKRQAFVAGDQAEQAVAFLPANHAFGMVRDVMLSLGEKGYDERYGLFNSIHDSLLFHCAGDLVEECSEVVAAEMSAPSPTVRGGIAPAGLSVGVEVSVGESLAELK